jgi:chemotaxis signal transduction protein
MMPENSADSSWLRFKVRDRGYAIPLDDVVEVAVAKFPRLIPLVPLNIGGVLNAGGEPLPVVNGGILFDGRPTGGTQHALVLERDGVRVGVLVTSVSRITRRTGFDVFEGEADAEQEGSVLVRWGDESGEPLGLVNSEALLIRAKELLMSRRPITGEGECSDAF